LQNTPIPILYLTIRQSKLTACDHVQVANCYLINSYLPFYLLVCSLI